MSSNSYIKENASFLGVIALDIDGTVTADHDIPSPVLQALNQWVASGWQIAFITGRTFGYGFRTIQACSFPYWYAFNNGAMVMRMPSKEIIRSHRLPISTLPILQRISEPFELDLLLYTHGIYGNSSEKGEKGSNSSVDTICFWRPHFHSVDDLTYLQYRQSKTLEPWIDVESFASLSVEGLPVSEYCVAKLFGRREVLSKIEEAIHQELTLATTLIADPLRAGYSVLMVTHFQATKGYVIVDIREQAPNAPIIAAGDDWNDFTMLQEADVGIAMGSAPDEVKQIADLVAKPAAEMGLIGALEEAKKRVNDLGFSV